MELTTEQKARKTSEEKCFQAIQKAMDKYNCSFRVIRNTQAGLNYDVMTYQVTAVHKENLPKKEELEEVIAHDKQKS